MDDDTRVGDRDREDAIDALRRAVGEGRLTLDEFGDRAGAAYGAKTLADLRAVLVDLPDAALPIGAPAPSAPAPAPPPPVPRAHVVAVMSSSTRKGRWRVPSEVQAIAVMGGVCIDLYDAELTASDTTIRAFALMGGVEVLVPRGVPVEVDGFVLMGGLDDRTDDTGATSAPMVRVIGHGLWGGVVVRHRREDAGEAPDAASLPTPPPRIETSRTAPADPPVAGAAVPAPPGLDGRTATLLFTDIVESSAIAERLGDQRWYGVLRAHNALVREQITRHGGQEIKTQGDGFMVGFHSARRALLAAIDIQRALRRYRDDHPDTEIHARIGLHTGEVVADDGDLYGRNVILASRLTAEAGADEVLASALTKQLAEAGGDLVFGPERPVRVKGLSGDWPVHLVEWM